jgi:hypothetical protein
MLTSYQAGYYTGRLVTKIVKTYFGIKLVKSTISKTIQFSKNHKIDSKNVEVVTENIFQCLQYLD